MTEIDLTPVTRLEYDIDAILNDHAVAEPITRIELILADIVAGNTTTVEPVTRIETYLAIISGADYPVPEPVTRIETFLAIITGEDYETPEAVTRLEGLLAEWVEKGSGIWKTVTGTLIHITDALASPMQKCEVSLEPIQDLHGQDAPYPAGGGVNMLNADATAEIHYGRYNNYTLSNGVVTVTGSTLMGFIVKVAPSTEYTYSLAHDNNKGLAMRVREYSAYPADWEDASFVAQPISKDLNTGTTGSATFTTSSNTEYIVAGFYDGEHTDQHVSNFQIELGSTATPYSPYSNICPITGWTGCEVTRAGLNICVVKNLYIGGVSGLAIGNDGVLACFNGINGQTYRISGLSGDRNILYKFRGKMDDIKSGASMSVAIGSPSLPYVFTADETCIYCFYRNSTWSESIANSMKVTIGDSATDYEALNIATASVTFPDSAGTVYGGTLDLVSGVLTVDRVLYTLDGSEDEAITSGNYGAKFKVYPPDGIRNSAAYPASVSKLPDAISNLTKPVTQGENWNSSVNFFSMMTNKYIYFNLTNEVSSVEELRQYLAETNIVFCLKLKDSAKQTYQLTPQEISTLKGENNVWGSGDIELTYKAQSS